jgi:uncharacterized membrane protein
MGRKLIFLLLFLVGCISLSKMNQNMEATNELMTENMEIVRESISAVEANTAEIKRSIQTMYILPFIGLVFLILLLVPIFILLNLYRKMAREANSKKS